MSVGAGSIKRAAKAASTNAENITEEKVVAKAETTVKAAEKEAQAPKATAAPKAKKPAAKKTTARKSAEETKTVKATEKAQTKKPAVPKTVKKSNYNSDYEAYGVGQQLPTYLM